MVVSRLQLDGAQILDLFAGTGALGLEAMSRGAEKVTFVESNTKVVLHLKKNIDMLDLQKEARCLRGDALSYLRKEVYQKFDLIFADPPYELEGLTEIPDLAMKHIKHQGYLFLEHDKRHSFKTHPFLDTSRPYGRTTVSIFMKPRQDEDES